MGKRHRRNRDEAAVSVSFTDHTINPPSDARIQGSVLATVEDCITTLRNDLAELMDRRMTAMKHLTEQQRFAEAVAEIITLRVCGAALMRIVTTMPDEKMRSLWTEYIELMVKELTAEAPEKVDKEMAANGQTQGEEVPAVGSSDHQLGAPPDAEGG